MKAPLGLLFALVFFCTCADATVLRGTLSSPSLGVEKAYRIYLPIGYDNDTQRYPVIYLLHGWGVTEDYWVDQLGLAQTADALKLQAIIVMPDGDRSFYANSLASKEFNACKNNPAPQINRQEPRKEFCVRTPMYENYIIQDLIPHIDARYRTIPQRDARGISGESAGGFGAMQLALRNKEVFSSVAAHSAFLSLLYDGPRPYQRGKVKNRSSIVSDKVNPAAVEAFGTDFARWGAHDPVSLVENLRNGELAIYFDCGTEDEYGFHDEALYFHERLVAHGIVHRFESIPGLHEDALWKRRIKHSLQFHADHFRKRGVYGAR